MCGGGGMRRDGHAQAHRRGAREVDGEAPATAPDVDTTPTEVGGEAPAAAPNVYNTPPNEVDGQAPAMASDDDSTPTEVEEVRPTTPDINNAHAVGPDRYCSSRQIGWQ